MVGCRASPIRFLLSALPVGREAASKADLSSTKALISYLKLALAKLRRQLGPPPAAVQRNCRSSAWTLAQLLLIVLTVHLCRRAVAASLARA
jgi:hypothetical protein